MSTDPREFEHPIDGTTPNELPTVLEVGSLTDPAVDAAADALQHWMLPGVSAHAVAIAALTAAYPIMAAEVLRDTAKDFAEGEWVDALMEAENDVETVVAVDEWLNHRAATIESEAPNV